MKRIIFYFILIFISCLFLEISSFTLYFLITHKLFTYPQYYAIKEEKQHTNFGKYPVSIHPYLGYVGTPYDKNKELSTDNLGFAEWKPVIQLRSYDRIVVGILGGSLACLLGETGTDAIKNELRKIKFYNNKKFIFLNLGGGGYKEPQQLLTLNYLLALGGSYDIIINLDGFNDITLPVIENIPHHVFPFYPRSWDMLVSSESVNYDNIRIIYEAHVLERIQKSLVRVFSSFPLRYSITANLFYKGIDHVISNEIAKLRLEILNKKSDSKRYAVTGPTRTYKNDNDMYEDLAMVWKNSSLQISKICASNHTEYFHFLQPNQYVPNSKIINDKEFKIAISKWSLYKKPVEEGYPFLRQAGRKLVKEGVNFSDLTYIFAHNKETLYSDTCCHLNQKGLDLLGQIIGETIVKDIQRTSVVPVDFDWQQYLANYPDLQRAGFNTREKAEKHWMEFGYFEKRSYRKLANE